MANLFPLLFLLPPLRQPYTSSCDYSMNIRNAREELHNFMDFEVLKYLDIVPLYRRHCVVMISILVTPRVSALAGFDKSVSEPLVIETVEEKLDINLLIKEKSDSDLESTARSGPRDNEMEDTGGSGIQIND
ncbi:hypothetical protein Tco_0373452 [Tanacetum coccineum]